MTYLYLFLVGLLPVCQTVIVFFVKKKTAFGKIPYKFQQLFIGLFFGVSAILGTVFGVPVSDTGAVANARDAAPLCAGLLFGGPSGIIAGLIGGTFRFVGTYWGVNGAGEYSQIACSLSTVLAGFLAAFLRRFTFEKKHPSWAFAFATALVMEVIHMTLIFVTHMDNVEKGYEIVKFCTFPMIICNSVSVGLATLLYQVFSKEKLYIPFKQQSISKQMQGRLLFVVVIAFITTSLFVYFLQTNTIIRSAESSVRIIIDDVAQEIKDNGVDKDPAKNRHVWYKGFIVVADENKVILSDTSAHSPDPSVTDKSKYIGKPLSDMGLGGVDSVSQDSGTWLDVCGVSSRIIYQKFDKEFFDGKYDGSLYIIGCVERTDILASRDNMLYINSFLEIIIFAVLFDILYALIRVLVVKNIDKVNGGLGKIIEGDLSVVIDVNESEEFTLLSKHLNTSVDTLKKYIEEAKQRIAGELAFAKNIQHSSLPSVFPAYPEQTEKDIYANMYTAKEVGGDFYDFYMLSHHRLAFIVADVSGKGIPAAMFMMRAKSLLKSSTEAGFPLNKVMEMANENLNEGNDTGMFVTAWMGIINLKTGHVDYVNAGHNPPYLYRKGEGFNMIKCKADFVIAGLPDISYNVHTLDLKKGDRLFLYTDGVTEAINEKKELFGDDRLKEYLDKNCKCSCSEIIEGLKLEIDKFAGETDQFDDITMLALDYYGYGEEKMIEYKTKDFIADDKSLLDATAYLESFAEEKGASIKTVSQLSLAFEEAFVNIAHYAYPDKEGKITVGLASDDEYLYLKLEDFGLKFNPLEKKDPDIGLSAEERNIGGLGIYLVKKSMDNVSYEYKDNKNVLVLTKKLK